MRTTTTTVFFFVLALASSCSRAGASPLDCERIKDPDQRHLCRAVSIPSRTECEFIRNNDLRQWCRARTS